MERKNKDSQVYYAFDLIFSINPQLQYSLSEKDVLKKYTTSICLQFFWFLLNDAHEPEGEKTKHNSEVAILRLATQDKQS